MSWPEMAAERDAAQAELNYAEQALADYDEAWEILRPHMTDDAMTVAEAMARLSPEDAARVIALAPRTLRRATTDNTKEAAP